MNQIKSFVVIRSLIIAFVFSWALPAFSQTSTGAEDPVEFFSRIWSPFCHGISLLECPSSQAEDLRKEIRDRIKNGEQLDNIFKEVNQKYGNTLRMLPAGKGRESLAYWIPWVLFFLVAIGVIIFWFTRKKKPKKNYSANIVQNKKILEDLKTRL